MRKFLIATCPMILIRGTIHLGSFFDWTPYYVYFYGEVEWIMAAIKILHGTWDHGLYSSSKTQLTITTKRAVNFGLSSHRLIAKHQRRQTKANGNCFAIIFNSNEKAKKK